MYVLNHVCLQNNVSTGCICDEIHSQSNLPKGKMSLK